MDTQFKNVKTHARLLSKAMWYEWRMKLLDGLKDGLLRIRRDFDEDAGILTQQEQLLQAVLPQLVAEHEQLAAEAKLLQAKADELASCDQEELEDAREQLVRIDAELEEKRQMVAELQEQLREREQAIEDAAERKQECQAEIKEAERVREECRGWTGSEVAALKGTFLLSQRKRTSEATADAYHSQCRCAPRPHRLDHHIRFRPRPYPDLQVHPSALPHALVLSLLRPDLIRPFSDQPHVHRRSRPLPPHPPLHVCALLPAEHARAAAVSRAA